MSMEFVILPSKVGYEDVQLSDYKDDTMRVYMSRGHARDVSDGYHTFDDLYRHRMALTLLLMATCGLPSWISKQHHPEDDPMFDDFFVVGIDLPTGTVTYHYKLRYWDLFAPLAASPKTMTVVLDHAPKFDGHTPTDVINRLEAAAEQLA